MPAIEGWFTLDEDAPALLGSKCTTCGNFAFPRETYFCRNPECQGTEFAETELSRTGKVWSYTDACYQPPKPYESADPYVPFAIAAVELAAEQMVVMGQVVPGVGVDDLAVGDRGRAGPRHPLRGRRARVPGLEVAATVERRPHMPDDKRVAVLGAGMHPWGKWGRNFVEYGLAAAGDALREADLPWTDVQYVAGADTIRNGYPGFIAGATFAQALGWTGARVSSAYAACASGAQAINNARAQILAGLCDVALVVGADTTPKGFFTPVGGDRKDDPGLAPLPPDGRHQPHLLRPLRPPADGAVRRHRGRLRRRQGEERPPRAGERQRPLPQGGHRRRGAGLAHGGRSAAPAGDLRHLRRGGGPGAHQHGVRPPPRRDRRPGDHRRGVHGHPPIPPDHHRDAQLLHRLGAPPRPRSGPTFKQSVALAAYEEAGIGPDDVDLAEVYDLSSALELDWYEDIGLCKEGEAERLLRDGDTTIGGRVPVNPSGGLSCFGEAIPAQAIAQVCELVWQLRGQAGARQVEGATVGITANQGLFGHGSSIIVSR